VRYTIRKRFTFSAAHWLEGLPKGHQCARLHGHNYVVTIELAANGVNSVGMVRDYGDLAKMRDYLDSELDHRSLNDVLKFNPTAEQLAGYLYSLARLWFPETQAVAVEETPNVWAECRRDR